MTRHFLLITIILIPFFSFGQNFKLFKSKKENGEYVANSFVNYECEIVKEEVMTIASHPPIVIFDVLELDSMELYLIPDDKVELYSSRVKIDSIELVVKPNKLEKVFLKEEKDTSDYKIKGTGEIWFLGKNNKSRNSSSWQKIKKDEDVYEIIYINPKYENVPAKPNEYKTYYYMNEDNRFSEIVKKEIIYYKFIVKEARMIDIPVPYQTITKAILTHRTQIYPVKTISNKQAKKLLPEIKEKLKSLNYYQGKINKKIDNNFVISMTNFQKDNQLPIGQFDYETLKTLKVL